MSQTNSSLAFIRDLIAKNEIKEAIKLLRQILKHSPKLDEVLQQSSRFSALRKEIRQDTIDYEDVTATENKISKALLELISEVDDQMKTPEIKAEFESASGGKTLIQNAEKIYNIDHIDNATFN